MTLHPRKWLLLFVGVALALLIDQGAKGWVLANMQEGEMILLADGLHPYLQLTRTANTGIAFGIGSGGSEIFLILSLIITAGLLFYYSRTRPDALLEQIGLTLVIGGALGNVIDRIRFGHVVDFFHIRIPPLGISNVSNFADHMIVIGVVVLLLASILYERHNKRDEPIAPAPDFPAE